MVGNASECSVWGYVGGGGGGEGECLVNVECLFLFCCLYLCVVLGSDEVCA